ncbi:TPA: lysine--tRNA ligase [Candidatus Uhrbacteria bacterium]|nr:lysine--tRNA ligase [Candidatus Uhrbacteria bacterium]
MAQRISKNILQADGIFWGKAIAEEIIRQRPEKDVYVVSSGISPSGPIHFGNFREIVTQHVVKRELEQLGKKVRFVFVWDDFDAMRKVPAGVDESFAEFLRKPLSAIPSPTGEGNWAQVHERVFEATLKEFGIETEFLYQTQAYKSGQYDAFLKTAMQKREVIARILLRHMSDKAKAAKEIVEETYVATFYPVSVFSSWTGKDTTEILAYDGESTITYRCLETGKEETIDFTQTHQMKFAWKVDWAMRWALMGVDFESAGKDHNSPNGSFDVSSDIVREVFEAEGPIGLAYEFIGIQGLGAKMSGSKGNAVTPGQLVEMYEIPLLLWLYARKLPSQRFDLAFNSEIVRQYSEFDREIELLHKGELSDVRVEALKVAGADMTPVNPIPLRQAIALGQIVQWDVKKVVFMLTSLQMDYNQASVASRLQKARAYLETYNREEMVALREEMNTGYQATLTADRKAAIQQLRQFLQSGEEQIDVIEKEMYEIPKREGMDEKELKMAQRAFFTDVYNLLIGKDTGPRLSTFLWAIDRQKALELLDVS